MRKGEQLTQVETMWVNALLFARDRSGLPPYKARYAKGIPSDYVRYQRAMRFARTLAPDQIAECIQIGKKGQRWIAEQLGRVGA